MEDDFMEATVGQRALMFSKNDGNIIITQCPVKSIAGTPFSFIVLFASPFKGKWTIFINEAIAPPHMSKVSVTKADMYRFLAVLLFTHTSRFSFEKAIFLMASLDTAKDPLTHIPLLFLRAHGPTGRGNGKEMTWYY